MLSTSCASLKYPNWEKVGIEYSVDNKPCVIKGIKEQCDPSEDACDIWFKKRATRVNANTVEIHSDLSSTNLTSKYFQCEAGLPLYKDPNKFNKEEYKPYLKSGINTVVGQAFLRQNGGGIVTCAGKTVLLYPAIGIFDVISRGFISAGSDEKALIKETQCDAQGNFEFYMIPAGNWVIKTNVSWDVYSVKSVGIYYYTANERQGGGLMKKITVQDGEVNKFIISN